MKDLIQRVHFCQVAFQRRIADKQFIAQIKGIERPVFDQNFLNDIDGTFCIAHRESLRFIQK